MKTIPLLSLGLLACGPNLPTTRCGAFVYGQTLERAQAMEDATVRAFQQSPDPRLHNVCTAMVDWTIVAEPVVYAPRGAGTPADNVTTGQVIGGYATHLTKEIHVKLDLLSLAHELAHVAQGDISHVGWDIDVYPVVWLVESGACAPEESCSLGSLVSALGRIK